MRASRGALAVVLVLAFSSIACAQSWFDPTLVDASPPLPATRTSHAGTFNGRRIAFDAVTAETVLADGDGEPATTVFSTAYLRTDSEPPEARPLLFLFNGGPGASSSPLHLGIGPMRRPADGKDGSLVPNPATPLDAVDLVFVDPPGTGYSRLFREGAGKAFWGIEEDADAILTFMNTWLDEHDRRASPLFVMGESYGATRVAAILARAEDLHFSGALLLSAALDYSAGTAVVGNNLPYVFLLPSMAATAAYHGVTESGPGGIQAVFREAAAFAQSDYAAALYQGSGLADDKRREIAGEVARLTGLPLAFVLEQDLRVDAREFADALLTERGLRTGYLDARHTGAIEDYADKRPPYNDPSMARGDSGGPSTGELLDEYFREQLATEPGRSYRTLNLHLNSQWNFTHEEAPRFYLTAVPLLQQGMLNDPLLEVFVGGGVFDLVTPIMAVRYAANQIPVLPGRFTFKIYEGGHSVFEHEESRVKLADDIRAFVAARLRRGGS